MGIYRVRIRGGGRKKQVTKGKTMGKPRNQGVNEQKPNKSRKQVAEERAGRACPNLRVLNSYFVGADSTYKFFEVILVDPLHKAIFRDPAINWISSNKHNHRELRGKTAAGKNSWTNCQECFASFSHEAIVLCF